MFTPNPGPLPGSSWTVQQKAMALIGRTAGLSLRNGQGVTGVVCGVQGGEVYVMQYLYARQFATFHYPLQDVSDILPFPGCG
ncbi:hypothetical protein [Paenibacillus methanolicus]|uniref:Uncharacterized protein n=1 Tax=Paenibacillus methanolicus TaxID=582686 RepID=A0A5S5CIF9_9BACL|nr:hypothetical protein [Paenibacillus methanolicus]TYP79502.1 hypothetical protein BCM02_101620 [Paenibacillus methanolicus]